MHILGAQGLSSTGVSGGFVRSQGLPKLHQGIECK